MNMQPIGAVAAKIVDPWSWYFSALKNPAEIGKSIRLHHEPHQGYFRTRRKGGQWEPVAIFFPEGSSELVAYRNGKEVPADEVWTYCATNPITYEQYQAAIDGKGFADEPPAPAIGDNSGDTDPFEAIKIELAGEVEQVADFMRKAVETQADADRIGIWARRLADLAKRADGEREREKAPHLQAGRDVDDKWRGPIADAKDWAAKAKKHVEPFLIAQKRAEEERAKRAREEAERQRQAARATEDAEERAAALQAAQEAERTAEVKNASAGRTGARVSIRTEKRAKITDFNACLMALKDRPEIIELVQSLANRAVKSGFPLAGVEVETIEKVA